MVGKPKIALNLLRKEQKAEKYNKTQQNERRRPSAHESVDATYAKLQQLHKRSVGSIPQLNFPRSSAYNLLRRGTLTTLPSESSIGIGSKEDGNFYHLPHKDVKYAYEHKQRKNVPDEFFHIDVGTDCETYYTGQKARAHYNKTEHFAYIVDLDNYEYHKVVFHSFLNEILQSAFFRYGILCLVMINSILIGLATLPDFKTYDLVFNIFDMVILSVFIFEVIIKWIYDFRLFWKVYWNVLDFFIIALTLMAAVIPTQGQGDQAVISVRVVRTFRSLRCVSSMTSLSIVTHTVIRSGLDMGNILLVLIIFMLVLSVMAVILFDIENLKPQLFLNALDAWFVLFICVTQDGWAEVLNGYDRSQSANFTLIALYLIFAVSVGAFVFANLIVAVIVANLELSVQELREEMKLLDNPLEFHSTYMSTDVEVIPVYDLLSKNNFVCVSQRPMKIPKLKKLSTRKIKVYVSLIVALEQNMLEAEIIALDLEKIIAVILSIIVQVDVNTGKLGKKEREEALKQLEKLAKAKNRKKQSKASEQDGGAEGPNDDSANMGATKAKEQINLTKNEEVSLPLTLQSRKNDDKSQKQPNQADKRLGKMDKKVPGKKI